MCCSFFNQYSSVHGAFRMFPDVCYPYTIHVYVIIKFLGMKLKMIYILCLLHIVRGISTESLYQLTFSPAESLKHHWALLTCFILINLMGEKWWLSVLLAYLYICMWIGHLQFCLGELFFFSSTWLVFYWYEKLFVS